MTSENKKCQKNKNEILVNNTLFQYNLNQVDDNTYELSATPCNVPTSVYCIGRISTRNNCCNNMEYFQAFINTDPVQIIQDCNLEQIISRSIEAYFDNISFNTFNNSCGCNSCGNSNFGLF
ncbi:MAG: hypothetical protein IJA65_01515 [Acholeplasmatales bacterium]|nr:hypothetical protein [Acholeplasmatales bacterium]